MTPKRIAFYACVATALGLALWLDPAPGTASSEVVLPVSRVAATGPAAATVPLPAPQRTPSAMSPSAAGRGGAGTSVNGAANAAPRLLAQRDRADMFGDAATREAPMFRARGWGAPAAPVAASSAVELPSLPFTYVGKQQVGGEWRVFLQDADDIHIVQARDTVAGAYRVLSVKPPTMTLEHLATHTVQTLEIE
ncbi:hypothetical protein [Roseateles noduli]|uniref:hypothetical protein n=1 Tax=Roseateles noduli TaxID=2052484 RepID=UPI003D6551DB